MCVCRFLGCPCRFSNVSVAFSRLRVAFISTSCFILSHDHVSLCAICMSRFSPLLRVSYALMYLSFSVACLFHCRSKLQYCIVETRASVSAAHVAHVSCLKTISPHRRAVAPPHNSILLGHRAGKTRSRNSKLAHCLT